MRILLLRYCLLAATFITRCRIVVFFVATFDTWWLILVYFVANLYNNAVSRCLLFRFQDPGTEGFTDDTIEGRTMMQYDRSPFSPFCSWYLSPSRYRRKKDNKERSHSDTAFSYLDVTGTCHLGIHIIYQSIICCHCISVEKRCQLPIT